MSVWNEIPHTIIDRIEVNDKTFSLHSSANEPMQMSLPKSALSAMIMHHEDILLDLENKKKPTKKYWSDSDFAIYTKVVCELHDPMVFNVLKMKVLCISKPPVDVALKIEMFKKVVLRATILNRIRRDDGSLSRRGLEYKLNSTKSIIFHDDDKFSIRDNVLQKQFRFSLKTLAELIMQRKAILADLSSQKTSGVNIYGAERNCELRTAYNKNSREFSFRLPGPLEDESWTWIHDEITLTKHTFDLMLHVSLGASMWKPGMEEDAKIKEARMLYWNSTPFNIAQKIEFSVDLQNFTLGNESYGVTLTLPTDALKVVLNRKSRVLSDLESKAVTPNPDKDFINEYWNDKTYAVRTGTLYNLYREIDCNVVRFIKVKDNECVFVAHKESFLKILESYENRRKNCKIR